jgi:hypothetical protein
LKRDPEKHGGDNPEKKERAKQKQAWMCKTGEWIALFIEHTAIGQACQIMSDKVSKWTTLISFARWVLKLIV